MYTLTVKTYGGLEKEVSAIDKEICKFYIKMFCKAEDFYSLTVTDGLTGEVLVEIDDNMRGWL